MANKLPRDLLVYFAFIALPIAGFLLAGTEDTQFYVSLFTISLLGIFGFQFLVNSGETDKFLVYNKELEGFSFILIMVGAIGCLFISTFLIGNYVGHSLTSIIVPIPKITLSVGSISLPPTASAVLFTLTLVAPAEECSKLVTSLGLFVWLKDVVGNGAAEVVAIFVPIAAWAFLHTYANPAYQGQYMLVFVGSAFLSGILIFYIMKRTKSLLAALLVHAVYNCIIIVFLTPH